MRRTFSLRQLGIVMMGALSVACRSYDVPIGENASGAGSSLAGGGAGANAAGSAGKSVAGGSNGSGAGTAAGAGPGAGAAGGAGGDSAGGGGGPAAITAGDVGERAGDKGPGSSQGGWGGVGGYGAHADGADSSGTSGPSGSAGRGGIDAGSGAAADGSDTRLELLPSSLSFFSLPMDSVRWAVSGYEPTTRTCVTVEWDYSERPEGAHCDEFEPNFPYVTMSRNADGPCQDWGYGGDTEVNGWTGCVDFKAYQGVDYVNSVISVTSPDFTGQIVLDNRSLLSIRPVIFGIRYAPTASNPLYVQTVAGQGQPAWITVTKDGTDVGLFDRCDLPNCGSTGRGCGTPIHSTRLLYHHGLAGGAIFATWDGSIRHVDTTQNCLTKEPAPAGNYQARFCYGASTTTVGTSTTSSASTDVVNPQCVTQDFVYPTEQVVVTVTGS